MIILSLGGSLIVPGTIDVSFLKKFRSLVLRQLGRGRRFVIVCGGGSTCRTYQQAARKLGASGHDRDILGIRSSALNAQLLATMFKGRAHPLIPLADPRKQAATRKPLIIAGGWEGRTGHSSDYAAVLFAKAYGARTLFNLSDIEHVHEKDPKTHRGARPLETVTWKGFQKIVGTVWNPGLNTPFDPVASKTAASLGLKVIVLNGKNLKNLEAALQGRPFTGTTIS